MSVITLRPGETYEFSNITGATGTTWYITIKQVVTSGADTIAVARTSTGVSEDPAGSGIYTKAVAMPTSAGDYYALWDNGSSYTRDEDTIRIPSSSAPQTGDPLDPFITVSDLSDMIGRDLSGDAGAYIAVRAACDTCRAVAERQFTRGTSTTSYDGTGTDALLLTELPVSAAGTVTVNGGTVTDYMLNGNGILLRGTAGINPRPVWPEGRQNVTVTYEHGYETLSIPEDVRMIALNVAARTVIQGVADQETVGDVSVRYAVGASDLTPTEKFLLRKYKHTR